MSDLLATLDTAVSTLRLRVGAAADVAVVLGSGSVTLDVLEDQVDAWIAAGGGS